MLLWLFPYIMMDGQLNSLFLSELYATLQVFIVLTVSFMLKDLCMWFTDFFWSLIFQQYQAKGQIALEVEIPNVLENTTFYFYAKFCNMEVQLKNIYKRTKILTK